MVVYEATHNSDLTEGKGGQVTVGLFDNLADAVDSILYKGVMGVGDGQVARVELGKNGKRTVIYGGWTEEMRNRKVGDQWESYFATSLLTAKEKVIAESDRMQNRYGLKKVRDEERADTLKRLQVEADAIGYKVVRS